MNQQEWNSQPDKVLDKALDEALARLAFDERPAEILADYPAHAEQLRPLLHTAASLKTLYPVLMPQAEALAADRKVFLAQVDRLVTRPHSSANLLAGDQLPAQAVSPPLLVRLKERITTPLSNFYELLLVSKEAKPMSATLLRAALIIVLFFGVVGGTAVVSAESLPDSALYPLKLAVEDTRLALTADPVEEAELNLALAETRLEEIEEMSLAGRMPGEAVFMRLEKHFDEALRLAAGMPEDAMAGFLLRTQDRIRIQENDLAQTQARINGPGEEPIAQANGILTRLRLRVESGLQEPQLFRRQHGRMSEGTPQQTGPCNNGECQSPNSDPPGNANQYGPGSTGYGPGPGDANGVCNNPGGCQSAGNGGYSPGPGDGVCDNPGGCGPAGNGGEAGPGPGDGDGVCDNPDNCESAGDADHYGQGNHHNNQSGQHSNQNNSHGGA